MSGNVSIEGDHLLPAPRDTVWCSLNDPEILLRCISGCESVTRDPDGEFRAVFRVGLGPWKGRLHAQLRVEETGSPDEYFLHARTHLRGLGQARGRARVRLECRENDTLLAYTAGISVTGWFARLGDSVLRSASDRAIRHFFGRFAQVLG